MYWENRYGEMETPGIYTEDHAHPDIPTAMAFPALVRLLQASSFWPDGLQQAVQGPPTPGFVAAQVRSRVHSTPRP